MARAFQDSIILFDVPGSLQSRMCEFYRRTFDILNRGFGGYNTTLAKPLLDEFLVRKNEVKGTSRVKLMTIWFGANDAVLPSFSQYVPLPLYLTNLTSFLTSVTDGKTYPFVPNIILITPPPLLQSMMPDPESRPQRELTNTKKYRQGVLDLASEWKAESAKEEWRVGVIDVWEAIIQDAGGEGEELRPYFTDGLHLSAKGYEVLWKEYTKLVKGEFKGRGLDWDVKEGLPWAAPDWSEVDLKRPDSVRVGMGVSYRRD